MDVGPGDAPRGLDACRIGLIDTRPSARSAPFASARSARVASDRSARFARLHRHGAIALTGSCVSPCPQTCGQFGDAHRQRSIGACAAPLDRNALQDAELSFDSPRSPTQGLARARRGAESGGRSRPRVAIRVPTARSRATGRSSRPHRAPRRARRATGRARTRPAARRGHRLAEELRRDVGELVRLVEDQHLGGRQQIGDALVAKREIGAEQVVIDHDDVGALRRLSRPNHEAARPSPDSPARGSSRESRWPATRPARPRPPRRIAERSPLGLTSAKRSMRRRSRNVLAAREPALGQVAPQVIPADVVRRAP